MSESETTKCFKVESDKGGEAGKRGAWWVKGHFHFELSGSESFMRLSCRPCFVMKYEPVMFLVIHITYVENDELFLINSIFC